LKTVSKSTGKCVKPLYSKLSTVSWYIGNGLGVREKQDESAPGTSNSLGDQRFNTGAGTGISVFGDGVTSGLDAGSDVDSDTDVSVFGGGVTSGLDAGSDVDSDTDVSVFGGGVSSCTGADSGDGDGDGVMVDSPELHALTTDKDINITGISPFWNCLRHITV
jgi:hypothetical protein